MLVFMIILSSLLICSVKSDLALIDPIYPEFSEIDFNKHLLFSSMTQYFQEVQHCSPVRAWFYMRHGTKYPSSDILDTINNELVKNIQTDLKLLYTDKTHKNYTELQHNQKMIIDSLLKWNNVMEKGEHKDLNDYGRASLRKLGKKMNIKLKDLTLTLKPYEVEVLAAEENRCVTSAKIFLSEFFDGEFNEIDVKRNIHGDERLKLLKPDDQKIKIKTNDGYMFIEDYFFKLKCPKVTRRIKKLLFGTHIEAEHEDYRKKITDDIVKHMYYACTHGSYYLHKYNDEYSDPDAWCNCFLYEDFKMFENWQDLQYYYRNGYHEDSNIKLGNALVEDMLMFLKQPEGLKFKLFSGHTSNCLSLITRFNLFKDEVKLNAENIQILTNKKWRTSFISPFMCNILVVVYDCKYENFQVSLFINDVPVKMVLNNKYGEFKCERCPLNEFINLLLSFNIRDKPLLLPISLENLEKKNSKKDKLKANQYKKSDTFKQMYEEVLKMRSNVVLHTHEVYSDKKKVDKRIYNAYEIFLLFKNINVD